MILVEVLISAGCSMLHTMFCRVNKLFTILCFTACLVIVNTWQAFVVLATILMIQGICAETTAGIGAKSSCCCLLTSLLGYMTVMLTRCPVCAGTSDLAGQLVGAFVSTAMVFRDKDPKYYDKLMTEARDLYSAAVGRKKAYSAPFIYDCAPPVSG